MKTQDWLLVLLGIALLIGALIWTTDYVAVKRWLGEPPRWYWHQRWQIIQTTRSLLDVSQIYAVIGIAFICLSMWAHRHPHIWRSTNWPPSSWNMMSARSASEPSDEFEAPPTWALSNAGGNGRELKFKRYIKLPENDYSYWSETVAIKVRPYWAWHVWPRTYYRLEVGFTGTDAFHNPASETNDHVSIYHPRARVDVTFTSGSASYGPIRMEKAVTSTEGVSYNYGAIRGLLKFLERNPGDLNVHADLYVSGKLVGTRDFQAPNDLTPKMVGEVNDVWSAGR